MLAKIRLANGRNVLIELLMLIVGINIALWFEGKFEDFRDAETEQQYLQGLRDDLTQDYAHLESLIQFNRNKLDALERALAVFTQLDDADRQVTVEVFFEPAGYDFFQPSDYTYRSMQESGDFRLLSDPELKRGILRLAREYRRVEVLQQNFIQALDDEYIPLLMRNVDLMTMEITQPEVLKEQVFRNFFVFAVQDTTGRMTACKSAREQVKALLELIDRQL